MFPIISNPERTCNHAKGIEHATQHTGHSLLAKRLWNSFIYRGKIFGGCWVFQTSNQSDGTLLQQARQMTRFILGRRQ